MAASRKPPTRKSRPRNLVAIQRTGQALEMRAQGHTYLQIGQALGITAPSAHELVMRELEREAERNAGKADLLRELENQRMDELWALAFAKARTGDKEQLPGILAALRVSERRSKLLGLDAPVKQEVVGDINAGVFAVPLAADTVDAWAAMAAAGAAAAKAAREAVDEPDTST